MDMTVAKTNSWRITTGVNISSRTDDVAAFMKGYILALKPYQVVSC